MSTLIGAVAGATTTVRKKVPPKFKLILAGDSCVAKQEYINAVLNDVGRTATGPVTKSLPGDIQPLLLHTNRGPIQFYIWDCEGEEVCTVCKN